MRSFLLQCEEVTHSGQLTTCQISLIMQQELEQELGNPKLVLQLARLRKEGGCVDLSIEILHPKDPQM